MGRRYKASDITSLINRNIFFDANVMIYLYWPSGYYDWEKEYSTIFRNILKQKNNKYVDFTVISEIINRALRTEYEKHLQQNNLTRDDVAFKDFRNSKEGESALNDIYQIIRTKVLSAFYIFGSTYSNEEIESFLSYDSLDFNDKAIALTCKENDFILLTNDKDFKNADIEILTSNPALLKIDG
jgi:predicted nucleic acid-binding protein